MVCSELGRWWGGKLWENLWALLSQKLMAFKCWRGLLSKLMPATFSAKSRFSVNLLKPHCMTQMKPTAWTKLATALALVLLMLIILQEWCSAEQTWVITEAELLLVRGWHQTDTGGWAASMLRNKICFFISRLIIPHCAEKMISGVSSGHVPFLSSSSISLWFKPRAHELKIFRFQQNAWLPQLLRMTLVNPTDFLNIRSKGLNTEEAKHWTQTKAQLTLSVWTINYTWNTRESQ